MNVVIYITIQIHTQKNDSYCLNCVLFFSRGSIENVRSKHVRFLHVQISIMIFIYTLASEVVGEP